MSDGRSRLAVLGSPISHSQSPVIHRAAYAVLGLDWTYGAVETTGATLAAFISSRDATWRGLSLTMPLKRDVLPLLQWRAPMVELVGGANTVLFSSDGLRGYNTDVYGVERSFRDAGIHSLGVVHVLGAGATAASVIAGVAKLGATRVVVSARTRAKALPLVDLGSALGVVVELMPWGIADSVPDAIVSTLPGGQNDLAFPDAVRGASVLFDVAYDPWPSRLASDWAAAGGRVISGLELLLFQALGQIRTFVGGDPDHPLPNEDAVLAAMRGAVAQQT